MPRPRREDPTTSLRRFFRSRGGTARPGPGGAPWWARWLLEIAIWLLVLSALAWLVDWLWFGEPVLQCGLFTVVTFPLAFSMPVGVLLVVVGILAVMAGRRPLGLALLVGGTLLAAVPDLLPGALPACA